MESWERKRVGVIIRDRGITMKMTRIVFMLIFFICMGGGFCSASIPKEDLVINGITLEMDRAQVESKIGTSTGTEKYGKHVVYLYDRGQVKIIYVDNKVIRMKITDRAWKNIKGLHCGSIENDISRIYGAPNIFGDEQWEKSYIYYSDKADTITFIAIDGYIQEIVVEGKLEL